MLENVEEGFTYVVNYINIIWRVIPDYITGSVSTVKTRYIRGIN